MVPVSSAWLCRILEQLAERRVMRHWERADEDPGDELQRFLGQGCGVGELGREQRSELRQRCCPALLRLRFWKELEKNSCPGGGARTVPQHPQPRHAALASHPPPHLSAGQGAKVSVVPQATGATSPS